MNKTTNHYTCDISEVLSDLLYKHNITPTDLSSQTNVPEVTIMRLLKNKNSNPTLSTLLPIAKYFKITINDLCCIQH